MQLDHRLFALADRAGGDGGARVEDELPRARDVLAADEDRHVREARVDRRATSSSTCGHCCENITEMPIASVAGSMRSTISGIVSPW